MSIPNRPTWFPFQLRPPSASEPHHGESAGSRSGPCWSLSPYSAARWSCRARSASNRSTSPLATCRQASSSTPPTWLWPRVKGA
jgi:hypothetical protein